MLRADLIADDPLRFAVKVLDGCTFGSFGIGEEAENIEISNLSGFNSSERLAPQSSAEVPAPLPTGENQT